MLSKQLQIKRCLRVRGRARAAAAERGSEQIPEAFPGAQQRFSSRRGSRLCSHEAQRLLNASVVGENQTAAMHGGRRRAHLLRTAAFLFFPSFLLSLFCPNTPAAYLFILHFFPASILISTFFFPPSSAEDRESVLISDSSGPDKKALRD